MFETASAGRLAVPSELGSDGTHLWAYVRQTLALPWFHLSVECTEREYKEPCTHGLTLFATRREQWVGLEDENVDTRIEAVQLVSPPWLNGTTMWRMELLEEIWDLPAADALTERATIYIVEGGRRYVDPESMNGVGDHSLAKLVYRANY